MNWGRIRAIIRKDLREVGANRMALIPMIIVPVLMCVIVPGAITAIVLTAGPDSLSNAASLEQVIPYYPVPAAITNQVQRLLYVILNYTFVPFFMIVPLMLATIVSANAVVGEKERGTLETLLYTPITNRELATGKLLAAFLPAASISFGVFIIYFIVLNVLGYALAGVILVRSLIWIPVILLLAPAVSLLGLAVTLQVSFKAKSFTEAQQIAAVVVIPIVGLVLVQVTGVVIFNALYVILAALALGGLAYFLLTRVISRFNREKIISTL